MHEDDYVTIKYSQETGIEQVEGAQEFSIRVYPNPVNAAASVAVTIPEPSECSLLVYCLDGRLSETLHRGLLSEGGHSFVWQDQSVTNLNPGHIGNEWFPVDGQGQMVRAPQGYIEADEPVESGIQVRRSGRFLLYQSHLFRY